MEIEGLEFVNKFDIYNDKCIEFNDVCLKYKEFDIFISGIINVEHSVFFNSDSGNYLACYEDKEVKCLSLYIANIEIQKEEITLSDENLEKEMIIEIKDKNEIKC